ncbi:hypothetical protein D3C78_1671120 [compost metagenome]
MPRETDVQLDDEYRGYLKELAELKGMTPEELAAKNIREELSKRTAPKAPKGRVSPFRRRP